MSNYLQALILEMYLGDTTPNIKHMTICALCNPWCGNFTNNGKQTCSWGAQSNSFISDDLSITSKYFHIIRIIDPFTLFQVLALK